MFTFDFLKKCVEHSDDKLFSMRQVRSMVEWAMQMSAITANEYGTLMSTIDLALSKMQ